MAMERLSTTHSLHFQISIAGIPNENQDFVEEKFKELDSDQIEGGEFEF